MIGLYPMVHVVSLNDPNEIAWDSAFMELKLLPGGFKGYWKYHAPLSG